MKKYAPLGQLAEQMGTPLQTAIELLETRGVVTLNHMRPLYGLLTPEFRSKALSVLRNPKSIPVPWKRKSTRSYWSSGSPSIGEWTTQ